MSHWLTDSSRTQPELIPLYHWLPVQCKQCGIRFVGNSEAHRRGSAIECQGCCCPGDCEAWCRIASSLCWSASTAHIMSNMWGYQVRISCGCRRLDLEEHDKEEWSSMFAQSSLVFVVTDIFDRYTTEWTCIGKSQWNSWSPEADGSPPMNKLNNSTGIFYSSASRICIILCIPKAISIIWWIWFPIKGLVCYPWYILSFIVHSCSNLERPDISILTRNNEITMVKVR